ncbi:hypothetical protein RF11_00808 [Thelohanellus kitauei]|uniref:Uncharacterized protein n=1 Tax=Thelohanellus kitauei TaxID=669202 RepID=A0A0C2MBC8_THEKT|nr:hypothetical protein RF11_00808 [Thelohanellus kitauei]
MYFGSYPDLRSETLSPIIFRTYVEIQYNLQTFGESTFEESQKPRHHSSKDSLSRRSGHNISLDPLSLRVSIASNCVGVIYRRKSSKKQLTKSGKIKRTQRFMIITVLYKIKKANTMKYLHF